jgi:hypothetical protein
MGKANKAVKVAAVPVVSEVNQVTAAPNAPTLFTVVPPKRPLTGVKYGVSGNAYTHAELAKAAAENGGTLTATQAMAVCKACSHQSFYSYAVNRLHILTPVVAAQ